MQASRDHDVAMKLCTTPSQLLACVTERSSLPAFTLRHVSTGLLHVQRTASRDVIRQPVERTALAAVFTDVATRIGTVQHRSQPLLPAVRVRT